MIIVPMDRNKLKEKNILLKIEAAKSHGTLAEGVAEVWIAAKRKQPKLLVAEKEILFPDADSDKFDELVAGSFPKNRTLEPKEAIEQAVENVLRYGGEVEFVQDGLLEKYKHVVIIQEG